MTRKSKDRNEIEVRAYPVGTNQEKTSSILGLSTDGIASLSAEELTENPTAIKMMLHYYRLLIQENDSLKEDNEALKYIQQKKIGSALLGVSNLCIGVGMHLLSASSESFKSGVLVLIIGMALIITGTYLSFYTK